MTWDQKKTTTERGYGYHWQKLREKILKRDRHLCQTCAKLGIVTKATQVDHIREKAEGGTDDPSNLQSICESCHKKKTSNKRDTAPCDVNGMPLDPNHPWRV